MDRIQKENLKTELKEKFESARAVFVTEYRGMTVDKMTDLRRKIYDGEGEYRVIKNRIAKIATKGTSFEPMSENFKGPVGLAIAYKDPVAVAKAVVDSTGKDSPLLLKSGFLGDKALSEADITALSKLPDRQTLLGMTVNVLAAPLRNFAGVLAAVPRDFANVMEAVKKEKE